jgi:hypothetical protein
MLRALTWVSNALANSLVNAYVSFHEGAIRSSYRCKLEDCGECSDYGMATTLHLAIAQFKSLKSL